jgi:DNA-binding transcriptional LysR family regulator
MDLRHLLTFQKIVEQGSFVQAAESLQYAQSTISLHMQQLEAALGIELFARHGKRVQLTEAGRLLYDEAKQILGRVDGLHQTMAELLSGEVGHLRFGSIEPAASLRLAALLVPFCAARPKVRLTLEVGGTRAISERVAGGSLDLGIISPPPAELGLTFEPLFVEAMALLVPEEHPLATAATITSRDLPSHRLLLTDQGCAYREAIERALLTDGTNPYSGIEIGSMVALKRAVQAGLGVAIVPLVDSNPLLPGTRLRDIEGVDLGLMVGLARRADDRPAPVLAALVELLRAQLGA